MSQMDPVFWGRRKFFEGAPLRDRTRRKLLEKNDYSCRDENFATWFWSTFQEAPWTLIFFIIKSIGKNIKNHSNSKFKNRESIPTTSAAIKNIECVPESNFEAIYQKTCEYFIFLNQWPNSSFLDPCSKDERIFWEILGFLDRKEANESD